MTMIDEGVSSSLQEVGECHSKNLGPLQGDVEVCLVRLLEPTFPEAEGRIVNH